MKLPEAGRIYTIREVVRIGSEVGFRLEEIENGTVTDRRSKAFGQEPAFHSCRFSLA